MTARPARSIALGAIALAGFAAAIRDQQHRRTTPAEEAGTE